VYKFIVFIFTENAIKVGKNLIARATNTQKETKSIEM